MCYDRKSVFAVDVSSGAPQRLQILLGRRLLSGIYIGAARILFSGLEAKIQDILRPIKSNTYSRQPRVENVKSCCRHHSPSDVGGDLVQEATESRTEVQ